MKQDRVTKTRIDIDDDSIRLFYRKRAQEKKEIDIDAPVVLCADKEPEKIEAWTTYELQHKLPLFQLNKQCRVLELGFGTGRISKYVTNKVDTYVGIDYVEEFVDIAKQRSDIYKGQQTFFLHGSLQDFVNEKIEEVPKGILFNRFLISGGVFVYMNDENLRKCIQKLIKHFSQDCLLYISEPIAIKERLTLNKFYSDNLAEEYSAIYRTVAEYEALFAPFYENGFKLLRQEEFFEHDIKQQKETKQWLFVLER